MGDIFGTIIPEAAEHMTYRTYRQQVISGNIANVDTPGYRSREALFEKELESRLKLTATDPGHLGKSPGQPCTGPSTIPSPASATTPIPWTSTGR